MNGREAFLTTTTTTATALSQTEDTAARFLFYSRLMVYHQSDSSVSSSLKGCRS